MEAEHSPQIPAARSTIHGVALFHRYKEDLSHYQAGSPRLRLFAYLTDLLLQSSLLKLMELPFSPILQDLKFAPLRDRHDMLRVLIIALTFFLYTIVPQALHGQTLGKRFFGLRVTTAQHGTHFLLIQLVLRETIGKALSLASLGIGLIMSLVREDRRTMHDLLFRTRVIQYRASENLSDRLR